MIKNLISYFNGEVEYSVNLHLIKTERKNNVMFITVTKVDDGMDYTVIFNGLPTPKNLLKVCEKDVEAAQFIIKTLKEDALSYAKRYWNFDKDEWEDNLDDVLFHYKESVGEIKCTPNVDTVQGLMDVYSKKGYDFKVGAKKYLNGDYSNNGSAVELYTIDSDWNPKFYITIQSKDGGVISDSEIKSHIEIFYK